MNCDIEIVFRGTVDLTASHDIKEMRSSLVEADLQVDLVEMRVPGVKDAVAIGLAIAGLAVSSIGTLISAVSLWQAQRPQYKVTIRRGDVQFEIGNLSREEVLKINDQLLSPVQGIMVIDITSS